MFGLIEYTQCTDKDSKKYFDSDFSFPCIELPKMRNFTYWGLQNPTSENRRLGIIMTSFCFAASRLLRKEMVQKCIVYGCYNTKDEKKRNFYPSDTSFQRSKIRSIY